MLTELLWLETPVAVHEVEVSEITSMPMEWRRQSSRHLHWRKQQYLAFENGDTVRAIEYGGRMLVAAYGLEDVDGTSLTEDLASNAQFALANIYRATGDYVKAEECCREAIRAIVMAATRRPAESIELRAILCFECLAELRMLQGNYTDSLNLLQYAIRQIDRLEYYSSWSQQRNSVKRRCLAAYYSICAANGVEVAGVLEILRSLHMQVVGDDDLATSVKLGDNDYAVLCRVATAEMLVGDAAQASYILERLLRDDLNRYAERCTLSRGMRIGSTMSRLAQALMLQGRIPVASRFAETSVEWLAIHASSHDVASRQLYVNACLLAAIASLHSGQKQGAEYFVARARSADRFGAIGGELTQYPAIWGNTQGDLTLDGDIAAADAFRRAIRMLEYQRGKLITGDLQVDIVFQIWDKLVEARRRVAMNEISQALALCRECIATVREWNDGSVGRVECEFMARCMLVEVLSHITGSRRQVLSEFAKIKSLLADMSESMAALHQRELLRVMVEYGGYENEVCGGGIGVKLGESWSDAFVYDVGFMTLEERGWYWPRVIDKHAAWLQRTQKTADECVSRMHASFAVRKVGVFRDVRNPSPLLETLVAPRQVERAKYVSRNRFAESVAGESNELLQSCFGRHYVGQPLRMQSAVVVDVFQVGYVDRPSVIDNSHQYIAFVVLPDGGVRFVDLGDGEEIDRAVRKWRWEIQAGGDVGPTGEWLRKRIWEPLEAMFPAEVAQVYLCPDGELSMLPWGALPGKRSGTVLLDQFALALVPHAGWFRNRSPENAFSQQNPAALPTSRVTLGSQQPTARHGAPVSPGRSWGSDGASLRPLGITQASTQRPQSARANSSLANPPPYDRWLIVGDVDYDSPSAESEQPRETSSLPPDARDERRVGPGSVERFGESTDLPSWLPLPHSRLELETLAGYLSPSLRTELTGRQATRTRVLEELPKVRWAHLATHGFHAGNDLRVPVGLENPQWLDAERRRQQILLRRQPLLLTGLVLAGGNQIQPPAHPGDRIEPSPILTGDDVAQLPLDQLELVVLSSCDSGIGEVLVGEGVFGLQRAFHLAGAHNVVASLWQVDDESTAVLMKWFYFFLFEEQLPPIEALRQAQRTLRQQGTAATLLAQSRGPNFRQQARQLVRQSPEPSSRTAPARLWAGFFLSGSGFASTALSSTGD